MGHVRMSLLLLLPLGLAALAALLLPVLLHLARRSEPRTVAFAALRWLRPRPQPQRRHRFEELLLLLVRLLLLALLALLLAQPVLFGRPDRHAYVAVAAGVGATQARAGVTMPEARWHRLAPGFPALDDAPRVQSATPGTTAATLPSLLRELDATLPAGVALTVVVPAVLDDADAQRPVLSRSVDWRVSADGGDPSAETRAAATRAPPGDAFRLAVRHAPDRAPALRYFNAAGVAWALPDAAGARAAATPGRAASGGAGRVDAAPLASPLPPGTRNLAWLAPGEVPAGVRDWVAGGGRLLLETDARWPGLAPDAPVLWRDADGALARGLPYGRGRVMQLQRPLLPAAMPGLLTPRFPHELRALFADAPPAPSRADARAYAPVPGAPPYPERPRPLAPWLAWAIAIAFLLERWLATGRRRSDAA